MVEALDIWVKGIVQGVGFRPFVYRLAKRYLVNGWVLNAVDGVHIHAEAESKLLDEFVMEISENAPTAAQVTEIEMHEVPLESFDSFEIRFSEDDAAQESTLVSPDLAMCADCERELFDPQDRRFRYPFINCTNCGPRFTITDALPYDRANTSMRAFPMCAECQTEYEDPADRRFHAQPDACFVCGPHLTWWEPSQPMGQMTVAQTRQQSDELLAKAAKLLADGGILAVKGLGGYHLACDANNAQAVQRLRERKHRDGKAFAVMMRTVGDVRQLCQVSAEEEALLTGMERPIVLCVRGTGFLTHDGTKGAKGTFQNTHSDNVEEAEMTASVSPHLAPGVAGKLPELGVMLPYTPVQHLLLHDFAQLQAAQLQDQALEAEDGPRAPAALVMTSGNLHDEPIVISDAEAYEKLSGIADAFLGNDRDILTRFDDTVLRVLDLGSAGSAVQFIRRARGYAPAPIRLGTNAVPNDFADTIFATGPEQKNTFTFLRNHEAFVSQHIGDVENAETFDAWLACKQRFQNLFGLQARILACDKHPEYLTTKWALEQAALKRTAGAPEPVVQVQHHQAHIVSALAENDLFGPVCGIAFDGTGFGADGNVWGGEVLLSNRETFERFANFAYVPMPGGAAAIKHPLRMAFGVLWEFDLLEHPGAQRALEQLGAQQAEVCERMIEQGLNTPVTSSVGRLFDAASALLGLCTEPSYEGEAAVLLEAAAWEAVEDAESAEEADERYAVSVVKNTAAEGDTAQTTSVVLLDAAPLFKALLDDVDSQVPAPIIALRFHDAMVQAIVTVAQLVEALYDIKDVVLTGGVFMNRYLMQHAVPQLAERGFTVILNRELPPNDGCVSLGQAVSAASGTLG